MRVLEYADVGHEQLAVVRGQADAERITTDVDVADDGRKVVRLRNLALGIDTGLNFGNVDNVNLEAALIHDIEVPPIPRQCHVAGEGALETQLRYREDIE